MSPLDWSIARTARRQVHRQRRRDAGRATGSIDLGDRREPGDRAIHDSRRRQARHTHRAAARGVAARRTRRQRAWPIGQRQRRADRCRRQDRRQGGDVEERVGRLFTAGVSRRAMPSTRTPQRLGDSSRSRQAACGGAVIRARQGQRTAGDRRRARVRLAVRPASARRTSASPSPTPTIRTARSAHRRSDSRDSEHANRQADAGAGRCLTDVLPRPSSIPPSADWRTAKAKLVAAKSRTGKAVPQRRWSCRRWRSRATRSCSFAASTTRRARRSWRRRAGVSAAARRRMQPANRLGLARGSSIRSIR